MAHHEQELEYLTGFANEWASEALPGALPVGQNSQQTCPYGLPAEQISGPAFTAPRHANRRSWFYRIRPGAAHTPFEHISNGRISQDYLEIPTTPNQLRWDPQPLTSAPEAVDFIDGLISVAGNGDPHMQSGAAIYLYAINRSMRERFFYSADGEMLIVLQQGRLRFATEFGLIDAE